jgi:hypothetical protein
MVRLWQAAQWLTFLHNCDVSYMLRIHYAMFLGEASEMSP